MSWRRLTKDMVEVRYKGIVNSEYYLLESRLNRLGAYAIKRRYDRKNNVTITTYKKAS